jgi:hypothetical protein
MRFAIASTLLVDSLWRVSALELHEKALELLQRNPSHGENRHLHDRFPVLKQVQDLRKKKTVSTEKVQALLSKQLFRENNKQRLQNFEGKVECRPHRPTEDADVGILTCGANEYCMESTESSLGGFCSLLQDHQRHLQQNATALDGIQLVCNLDENSPTVNCDVCTTDEAAYTGEFSCTYESNCVTIPGLCGSGTSFDFCGTDNLKGVVNGQDYYHRESCFDVTSPIPFSYCDSIKAVGDELTCEQSINGVTCNTCTLYYNPETGNECQAFDCTNTDLGVEGNDCSIPLIGALAFGYLYSQLPCPNGCSLCGAGRVMTNSGNDFTTDEGETVNCFGFQLNALTGDFAGNDFCETLVDNVQEPCGCVDDPNPNPTPNNAGCGWSMVTAAGATAAVSGSLFLSGLSGL